MFDHLNQFLTPTLVPSRSRDPIMNRSRGPSSEPQPEPSRESHNQDPVLTHSQDLMVMSHLNLNLWSEPSEDVYYVQLFDLTPPPVNDALVCKPFDSFFTNH